MPVRTAYIERENRLDLSVIGNLDLTISQAVCDICARLPSSLQSCVIDLSDVDRVFDSGVALLHMLHRRLKEFGTAVVIHGDHSEVRRRIPGYSLEPESPAVLATPGSEPWIGTRDQGSGRRAAVDRLG